MGLLFSFGLLWRNHQQVLLRGRGRRRAVDFAVRMPWWSKARALGVLAAVAAHGARLATNPPGVLLRRRAAPRVQRVQGCTTHNEE